ncbi:distal tail protein Dit [Rossellomorea sp. NPDC071047]|uniref:distal tail protein Dit n=1 Tax=Rossellomorea sp. NPDC071047 TaxID=3390675 RepID=UPI003CFD6CD4
MKSQYNFLIEYEDGERVDMDSVGLWVESFHIYSPNVVRKKSEIQGKHGATQTSSRLAERRIDINFQVETDSPMDLDDLKHTIYSIFYRDKPYKIIRDLTPSKYLFACQEGEYDFDNITSSDADFSITLTMLDPFIYGQKREMVINNPSAPFVLRNYGVEETPPYFSIELSGPTTLLDIIGEEDYMRIGRPSTVDDTTFKEYENVLTEDGFNLTGWTSALFTPDGGTKTGTMGVDSGNFIATGFGSGTNWHGPTLSKSLNGSVVIPDFKVRAYFDVGSNPSQRARTEVYLLDAASNVIGKVAAVLRKSSGEVDVEIALRNGSNVHYVVSMDWTYKEFFGYMDIIKKGKEFTFYIAQQGYRADGRVYTRHKPKFTFQDDNSEFQKSLAAIGMHIGTHSNYPTPTRAKIRKIEVEKINTQPEGIPFIGTTGDVFEFFHGESEIYKNGDLFYGKDFGARFFHLKPGENVFLANPPEVIREIRAEWRDKGT